MNETPRHQESGAATILFAILAVVTFAAAAFAVDIATLGQQRQQLWNTTDSAALAGVSALPGSFSDAEARAVAMALENDPSLDPTSIQIEYRCLVGDRDLDGQPDAEDVPASCDPGSDTKISAPPFTCDAGQCTSPCFPSDGDKCNTILVSGKKIVDFAFAPVIGINDDDTEVMSAACTGFCGEAPTEPVDLIFVVDRTTSMSPADLANLKNALLNALTLLDDSKHYVGLATLGASNPKDRCSDLDPSFGGEWLAVGLGGGYQSSPDLDVTGDGVPDLNSGHRLVSTVRCLQTSSQGTNLGSPLKDDAFDQPDALTELVENGRKGVKKVIVFMTDGQANQPSGYTSRTCEYAYEMAKETKGEGIELFTLGFGIEKIQCADSGGSYQYATVTQLLADMATQPSDDQCDSTGIVENSDGDHFFCSPKSSDLRDVFVQITEALIPGSRLVAIPSGS